MSVLVSFGFAILDWGGGEYGFRLQMWWICAIMAVRWRLRIGMARPDCTARHDMICYLRTCSHIKTIRHKAYC